MLAHRTYQYAMCLYKRLRYHGNKEEDYSLTWHKVDAWLRKAIEGYNNIKKKEEKYPLFLDLIVKITICRAHANNKNRKLLTSEKILEQAKTLISFIQKNNIQLHSEEREEAPVIELDILKQKYLLQKGLLLISLNKDKDACRYFTKCIRVGKHYDPRIRRECVVQLKQIFAKYGQTQDALDDMYLSFNPKIKDIIFLVNIEESMDQYLPNVKSALKLIFEKGIEPKDRISLITYAKNARKIFSLVEKEKNYI